MYLFSFLRPLFCSTKKWLSLVPTDKYWFIATNCKFTERAAYTSEMADGDVQDGSSGGWLYIFFLEPEVKW